MGRPGLVACRGVLTACGVGLCAVPGLGQGAVPVHPGLGPSFKRLDAGTADTGPLNRSLRQMQNGLRVDDAFQNVYEVAASPYGPVQYMRSAGGLYAVFPQSEYVSTRRGQTPVTPAGVVFWIGEPPMLAAAAPAGSKGGEESAGAGDGSGSRGVDRRVYSAVRVDVPSVVLGASVSSSAALRGRAGAPLAAPTAGGAGRSDRAGTMEDQSYRLSLLWRLAQQEKARLGIADGMEEEEPGG